LKHLLAMVGVILGFAGWVSAQNGDGQVVWTRNGAPTEAQIALGPWTLEQSGAAVGLKSAGYCDSTGTQVGNDEIQRMQPYYFPFIVGNTCRDILIGVRKTLMKE